MTIRTISPTAMLTICLLMDCRIIDRGSLHEETKFPEDGLPVGSLPRMRDHLAHDIRKRFAFDLVGCDPAHAFGARVEFGTRAR